MNKKNKISVLGKLVSVRVFTAMVITISVFSTLIGTLVFYINPNFSNYSNIITELNETISEYKTIINEMNDEIIEYQTTIQNYEYQLSTEWRQDILENMTYLQNMYIELQGEFSDYRNEKEQQINNLMSENSWLNSELSHANSEISELRDEIQTLSLEHIEVKGTVEVGFCSRSYVRFRSLTDGAIFECLIRNNYYSIEVRNFDTYEISVRCVILGLEDSIDIRKESFVLYHYEPILPLNL